MAQLCDSPAVMVVNAPPGALSCPERFEPQHVTVPSARTAQLCCPPVATATKLPAGAVVCPALFEPQHATVPSTRSAHVWLKPVSIAVAPRMPPGATVTVPPPLPAVPSVSVGGRTA